jgi:hypothetical protein
MSDPVESVDEGVDTLLERTASFVEAMEGIVERS